MPYAPPRRALLIFFVLCACAPPEEPETLALEDMSVAEDMTSDVSPPPPDVSPDASSEPEDMAPEVSDMPADAEEDASGRCGDGQLQEGEECDDGNDRFGDTCSPTCRRSYACDPLPLACEPAEVTTTEHRLERVPSCGFAMAPWPLDKQQARQEVLAALRTRLGSLRIEDVLSDLNREGRSGITAQSADRLKNHDWFGFRWNSGDMRVAHWYPQGMTGGSDASASGKVAGRDVVLVSWYHKTDERPTRGARLSLVDYTDPSDIRYRHLLLVEPTSDASNPSFGPVETRSGNALHVGGIVWYGDRLYVADTTGGLRVFDLTSIFRANDFDKELVGLQGPRVHAHGYAYAVPELMRYELHPGSCGVRFSFVSLDRTSTPHALVTGEYRRDDHNGRIVVWALDEETGLLDTRLGEVRAVDAFVSGQTRMQGAARFEDNLYISSSSQYQSFGRLYRTRPGLEKSSISAWVYGPEDLYIDRHTSRVWTPAEFPDARDVVNIPIREP